MYYAGIGSRDCPEDIGAIMTATARELEKIGFTLRSGGARGADTFFELGVHDPDNKQIFIHQEVLRDGRRHNKSKGYYSAPRYDNYIEAVSLAGLVHPHWHKCDRTAMALHARNIYQVLGPSLSPETHSDFVICWAIPDIHGVPEGGTRTAWNVAARYGIPRYNLAVRKDRDRVVNWLEQRQAA